MDQDESARIACDHLHHLRSHEMTNEEKELILANEQAAQKKLAAQTAFWMFFFPFLGCMALGFSWHLMTDDGMKTWLSIGGVLLSIGHIARLGNSIKWP